MSQSSSRVATMVEGALCIALAVTLSQFKLFRLPQGGSLNLELLPLLLFAWRRGLKWGAGAGALTGVVKILLGGYILNPVQAVMDYPLAFACAGLAALSTPYYGVTLAAAAQAACHVVSGAVFFGQYAPEGQNPWIYSIFYNMPMVALKYAVSGIAAWFLWRALQKVLPAQKGPKI